ncbi:MAG TPA: PAS domain-containing protein [Nitrospirae bacterium]|nr:sporulation kinase E [bacterium BMS3Bbin05]HDH10988.1 PAS domain-containing protein [Nitrospirota bacterium]HDL19688.1 PAS domain-containing protein [Nitrospirota bacterium]HDZ03092.1 PAS domain-containing protein [Nitrospirota bacterium]
MQGKYFIRVLIISWFVFLGLFAGALLVSKPEGNGVQYVLGGGALLMILVFIVLIRVYILKQRETFKTAGEGKEGSEVGFVVDTFHDLVARLKEKEKELEKLKAFAEEKAVRMEAYNENILQSVPSGVISVDNSTMITSINQAAERILGIDAREVIGRRFDEVFREPLTTLLSEDKTVSRAEYPYATNDRRHIWVGITTSHLKNTSGDKIGIIFVFTDLTDIKALQSQVELKQRLSQLGEMSAGISHELRNSMSVISGYAKLLSKKIEASNKATVDAIQSEINIMDRIISELLAFAKPTFLNMEEVVINELIKETAATVIDGNESVKVAVNSADPLFVKADGLLLRQAFTNLFANAVDAMPDGGSIEVELSSLNRKTEICIKDTGCGIPEEIKQKIFLPFYTTKQEGTGLGLALVHKIIVSHGGSIEVGGKEGEGAIFRIMLPAGERGQL